MNRYKRKYRYGWICFIGITNYNKELSATQISCEEAFNVRLSLTAEPDITANPVDIVLLLDRSGSMSGRAIANLKNGAKAFVDIIYNATGGTNGQIAGGTHIGIVSFADTATVNQPLITDIADLNPSSSYVIITPDDEELEEIFKKIAENISKPGATNIVITDKVLPCFTVTALSSPTKGVATMLDTNTVRWTIDELGVNGSEGAVFEFTVRRTGDCNGETEVNESIEYSDAEGNIVNFPSPTLIVECDVPVVEPCPKPVDYTAVGCLDTIEFDAGEIQMQSLGRVVKVDFTLQSVCPNKRVAVAVALYEIDGEGKEHNRGLKTLTIPAHTQSGCRDVLVHCVKFVLPEDLDVFDTAGTCNERALRVRILANYIDNDFQCCE